MKKTDLKKAWKKFTFLLWKDDSLKGWIFSIVFIFLLVRFVFFPLLSLVAGTSLPLAIVESCSMFHEGNLFSDYDKWFEDNREKYSAFGIEHEDFVTFPFRRGFNKGDILFVVGTDPDDVRKGDVIIFNANQRNPVIHRVVNVTERDDGLIFSTLGDNNQGQIPFEVSIREDQIVGKSVVRLAPYLGWVKLVFFEITKRTNERTFC